MRSLRTIHLRALALTLSPVLALTFTLGVLGAQGALAQPGAQPGAAQEPTGGGTRTSLVPAPPEAAEVTMLRLRDGGVRFGAIAGHEATHLEFTLLATGGVVQVPWSMLDPTQSNELMTRFGYIDIEAEEILVDAERLILTGGGSVEGVIMSREGDSFLIKTEGNLQMVPKVRVSGIEKGLRIPALDVYSVDELYNQYAAQASPTDPAQQWQLAETCEHLYSFARAAEHYAKVAELDPTYRAAELANIIPRVQQKALQQEQLDYLREADRRRKRGQWDVALDALMAFDGLYPNSPLLQDAQKQQARLILARDEAAKEYVAKRWFFWMARLTRELAHEDTLVAARAYVDEKLSDEIQKAVLADLQREISRDAQLEQIAKIFAERKKVRYSSTTYGNGTWLIGEEAALRGMADPSGSEAAPVNAVDAQRRELEDRIKQFLKNQRVASRGRQAEEEESLAQLYWASSSSGDRSMWLLAYYAENSGDLDIRVRPDLRACRTCAGKGALEVLLTGGGAPPDQGGGGRGGRGGGSRQDSGMQLQKCPTCQGVGVVRRVHFR